VLYYVASETTWYALADDDRPIPVIGQSRGLRISYGTVSLSYAASAFATSVTVTHNLGTMPALLLVTGANNATPDIVSAQNPTASTFQIAGYYAPGGTPTRTISAYWTAGALA